MPPDPFTVTIPSSDDPDQAVRNVLESIEFQNRHGNRLISYKIDDDQVELTYQGQ